MYRRVLYRNVGFLYNMEKKDMENHEKRIPQYQIIRYPIYECVEEIRILEGLVRDAKRRYWELRAQRRPLTWREWFWVKLGYY